MSAHTFGPDLRRIIREELRAALRDIEDLKRGIPCTPHTANAGDWVRDRRSDGSITFELVERDDRGNWLGDVVETTGAYTLPSCGFPSGARRMATFVDAVVVRRGETTAEAAEEREFHACRAVANEAAVVDAAPPGLDWDAVDGLFAADRSSSAEATVRRIVQEEIARARTEHDDRIVPGDPVPPEPAQLQFQVGHRYRARDGSEWDCVDGLDTDSLFFVCRRADGGTQLFAEDGNEQLTKDSDDDLVEDLGPTPKPERADHG